MTRKPLIVAEKPSAARAIAEALGGFTAREGYWESPDYRLSWAIGHLVELQSPEDYDPRWKRWSLQSLPIIPQEFGLKVVAKTRSQFQVLVRLGMQSSELINACDAGREGELIFRYICEAARLRAPVRRLWVSALTREAIRKAFDNLQPEAAYDRLYQSARCRAQGDWLVGMNATRAFTVKWGELLSVGRVQTPTLALLVCREREIEAFRPEPYWEVQAHFLTAGAAVYPGRWFGPDGDRLRSAEEADGIVDRVRGQAGTVESVVEKPVSERPPQLFDLTSLQREANKRFGLSAAATLKAAQSLYEGKLVTYPRTDSRYLPRELLRSLPAVVRNLGRQTEFAQAASGADLALLHPGSRRVINDAGVTDHHAIIPTAEAPGSLGALEAKVYGLIARRFLAQFYPEARFLETEVITRVGGAPDRFRSRGRRALESGWHAVEPPPAPKRKGEGEDEEAATPLPALQNGEAVTVKRVEALKKETQPPKRYTEGTLLAAMESAGRAIDDEALREAMKGRGLGTPATRAAIIERLKEVGYIAMEKKTLRPTPKGRHLVERAEAIGAQVLLSAELTGEWEKRIADIQAGEYQPDRFMAEVRELAALIPDLVRRAPGGAGDRSDGPVGTGRNGGSVGPVGTGGAGPNVGSGADNRHGSGISSDGGIADAESSGGADAHGEGEPHPVAGPCPSCGSPVTRQGKDWRCAGQGCPTRIPTWLCGLVIDRELAGQLLKAGRTPVLTGFQSHRTGKAFRASLVLKAGKVEFEFPSDRPGRADRNAGGAKQTRGAGRSTGGTNRERTAAAETGPRKARDGAGAGARTPGKRAGRSRVGRGASGASKPARTGADAD